MANGGRRRIAATEMVGVPLTSREVQWLLVVLVEELGPIDDPEVVTLQRKLKVMRQVARATEKRLGSRLSPGPER
jgi:hypothetical protein